MEISDYAREKYCQQIDEAENAEALLPIATRALIDENLSQPDRRALQNCFLAKGMWLMHNRMNNIQEHLSIYK